MPTVAEVLKRFAGLSVESLTLLAEGESAAAALAKHELAHRSGEDSPRVLVELSDDTGVTLLMYGSRAAVTTMKVKEGAPESFTPPDGVQAAAKRALEWIKEGHAGGNFTDVGRARAAQLANGSPVSRDTVVRMRSYLARHAVDAQATGWNAGEEGFPSPGRVAWDAWGGDPAVTWTNKLVEQWELTKAGLFVEKSDELRFTLGPMYVPDFLDAHGEWTDADELQKAVWDYVRSGNRDIYLQHDRTVKAGEWVECMTFPYELTVPMMNADGTTAGEVTYPKNTVFLGVQWEPHAWQMVKRGLLRGYSIGGLSDRMLADLPDGAMREGLSANVEA